MASTVRRESDGGCTTEARSRVRWLTYRGKNNRLEQPFIHPRIEDEKGTKKWPKLAGANLIPGPDENNSGSSRGRFGRTIYSIGRGGNWNSKSAGMSRLGHQRVDTRQD